MSDLLNQASLVMVPSGYKEDVVYSPVPTDGSGDLSFTRASNGTRVNSAGLVEVAPWNAMQYSEDFANAVWGIPNGGSSVVVTSNATTAPNGTTTADKIEIANGTNDRIEQVSTAPILTSGLPCTFSVYIKSISGTGKVGIRSGQSGASSVLSYTNEWQRLTWTFNALGTYEIPQFCNSTLVGGADSAPSFFVWGAQLNIGSTAKPYFPTTDRLNVPRLTYQNGGGGCPSLLLEKQSTNKWYYSEQFDNAEWLKTECTITANAITSPDGTQNADKITDTTANNEHRFRATSSLFTISTATTFSIFAKAGEYSKFGIADLSNGYIVKFDLSAGTIISTGTDWSNAKIENFGDGWYRLSATRTTNATCGYAMLNDAGDFVFTGTGTKGVYIWGAQVEESSYPTSYIPTTNSSATRVADVFFEESSSALIGQTEGTLFAQFKGLTSGASGASRISISSGTNANWIFVGTEANSLRGYIRANSGVVLSDTSVATTGNDKIAIAYKSGSMALYINGVQIATSSSSLSFSATLDDISTGVAGGYQVDDTILINQLVIFPTRLTNAELASLTTL